ncbi:MAG: hypothetical protein VX892_06055 [Candidatus Thermoplasmatota archaeon]|nr:hypothetical protein [Candidatus Thermoplasmatota archaeon]
MTLPKINLFSSGFFCQQRQGELMLVTLHGKSTGVHRVFRRKKTDDEILHCPLCSLENPLDANTCSRCYYDFTVSSHQQSRKSDDQVVGGLLDELTSGIEEGEEDENDVDWTNHSFDMSDFSVDVAEYDDSDDVVVSHSIGFARQLVSEDEIGGDVEDGDFVLSSDDAPTSVEKFIVPEEDESEISIPEPTMIKLVDPTSNSTNEMDSDLMNEDWNVTDSTPILNSEEQDVNPGPVTPTVEVSNVQKPPQSSALPPMPSMPQNEQPTINVETPTSPKPHSPVSAPPAAVFQHETPVSDSAPKMPVMPSMPVEQTSQPDQTPHEENKSIWPWVQSEPWDDKILASKIKEAMEAAKSERKNDASRILDEIGPHLSDKYRLMLYVGALLKNLGRTNELASMLNAAKISKSEDQHVAAALKQLG